VSDGPIPQATASLSVVGDLESPRLPWGEPMDTTGVQDDEVDERRRSSSRRILLATLAVLLVAAAVWAVWGRSTPAGHRLIYMETLPDGRVFQCFSDGAFIGAPGANVDSGRSPEAPDGAKGGPALVVRPPDYTDEEARRAAEEYKKSGRSPEQDQADFDRLSAECRRRR